MTGPLDEHGDLLAQAVSSRSGGSSISARLITFFRSIFSIPLLLMSNTIALVALDDEIPNSLRLSFDRVRLVGVAMSFEIAGRRTSKDRDDHGEPESRVEQHHNPRSHSERSNARRFTSPGSTRRPP